MLYQYQPVLVQLGTILLTQDWYDDEGEEELASKDKGNVQISTFYILGGLAGKGLGK